MIAQEILAKYFPALSLDNDTGNKIISAMEEYAMQNNPPTCNCKEETALIQKEGVVCCAECRKPIK